MLASIVQVIPGRRIAHAADEHRTITLEAKFAGIKRMLRSLENPGTFIALRGSKLAFFGTPGAHMARQHE
jgi:hypothetical protein